jgi:hypothetical protein
MHTYIYIPIFKSQFVRETSKDLFSAALYGREGKLNEAVK